MSRIKVALIGNCQVQSYRALLPFMVDRELDLVTFDASEPSSREEQIQLKFLEQLADRDIILAQRINFHHINDEKLRAAYPGRVLTIGNFYFRGLHPDHCYVGDFAHRLDRPSTVHSVVILDAFRRGLSQDAAIQAFTPETFERLGLFAAWQSSIDEMATRERNGFIDVPCLALMEAACRRMPAFLTMNHPSNVLLADYLEIALKAAGIPCHPVNAAALPDPLDHHDRFPILDLVAEHFNLPYRTAQRWKINALGSTRFVRLDELVAAFYQSYSEAAPASLAVHSPTDLVRNLRGQPDHAYLIDTTIAPPPASLSAPAAESQVPGTPHQDHALRAILAEQNRPVLQAVEEIRTYIHKVHSFMEVADPKIESLTQTLPTAEEIRTYIHKVHSFMEAADPKIESLAQTLPELARKADLPSQNRGVMKRMLRRIKPGE